MTLVTLTLGGRTILVLCMNYITTNAKGVTTIPFHRVGVPASAFPLFQLLEALRR